MFTAKVRCAADDSKAAFARLTAASEACTVLETESVPLIDARGAGGEEASPRLDEHPARKRAKGRKRRRFMTNASFGTGMRAGGLAQGVCGAVPGGS